MPGWHSSYRPSVFELITSPNSATHTLLPDIFTFSYAGPQLGFFKVKHYCLPTARRRDRIESHSTCRPLRNTEESRVHDESRNQKEPYKMMRYNWTNSSKVIKAQVNTV